MSTISLIPSMSPVKPGIQKSIPLIVRLFFLADALVVLAAIASHLIAHYFGREAPGFLRLSYESNLPTWYSSAQHAVVGTLLAILAVREIAIDRRRWCIALPALMYLFFSFDEVAMVHERIARLVQAHSALGQSHGLTNSAPGMIFCLPVAIAFAAYAAWSTKPYWQRRRGIVVKCVLGTGMILFCAGGLEIVVNLVKTHQFLVSLETLVEESGEMLGTTIMLWGVIELLAVEKLVVAFDAKGIHFTKA